jgi:signal peptidase II
VFLSIIGIDRWSKCLALFYLKAGDISLCPCVNFSLIWNRGISWGMLHSSSPIIFILLSCFIGLIILALAYYTFYWQFYRYEMFILWEIFVLAGAISNIVDRIVYGAVVDFIQLYIKDWYWPTFNVADMFVVIGIIGMFLKSLVSCHDRKNKGTLF